MFLRDLSLSNRLWLILLIAILPLFALTAYAKNERADLSQKDRNAFRALTRLLVEPYAGKGAKR